MSRSQELEDQLRKLAEQFPGLERVLYEMDGVLYEVVIEKATGAKFRRRSQ
jgi:hypothetical protein